jgi:PAS domain S-box-containing protein
MQAIDDRIHVLHADDDPAFARTAAELVADANDRIDVETVTNVDAALIRLTDPGADVDCVVSDYDMPGRDGIEFLETVREASPDLPFILYTGKGSEEVAGDAISAGVTDYLQKERGTDQFEILAHRIANAVTASRSAAESEQRRHRLEQILKTVPGCVVQLDPDGGFVYANRRAEEVLGLEQTAVTERTYNDPEWRIRDLAGDPIPDEELPFRRVLDSGEPLYGFQHTIEWSDGTRKVLMINGAPLFATDGAVESAVFSLVDLTDQHDRERTLQETERRLKLVLDATDVGVWEWDLETDDVWWNDTLERVMGLDPGAFEGTFEAFSERVHPDDRPEVNGRIDRAVETGEAYEAEFRMLHEAGDVHWVAVRGRLVEDADGRQLIGVHQDVTERQRLYSELASTTEQYRTLVENVPQGGVFLYDENLECVLAGGAGLADVGLSPSAIEGEAPSERYPDAIADEIETHLREAFDGREAAFEQTYQGRTYQVRTLPIGRGDGTIDRVMAVSREITEQKRRERTLEDRTERLEEFASVVSHDLRNPLRVAEGRISLARAEGDSEHLAAAETALDRMNRIIEDVLLLAREGQDVGETEAVDLRERVEAAWNLSADGREGAELVVTDAGSDSVETIEADASRLNQLLEDLFRNSVEHGSTSSRPRASDSVEDGSTSSRSKTDDSVERGSTDSRNASRSDDSVARGSTAPGDGVTVTVHLFDDGFAVEDDGPGVPETVRDRLFEGGFSTTEEGTGFGLSIVKRIADAHGWDVHVGESPSGGARFEVTGVARVDS